MSMALLSKSANFIDLHISMTNRKDSKIIRQHSETWTKDPVDQIPRQQESILSTTSYMSLTAIVDDAVSAMV